MNGLIAAVVLTALSPTDPTTIQDAINALPPEGGEIKLTCGTFTLPRIDLKDDVALVGSGPCTIVPGIRVQKVHPNSDPNDLRTYHVRIENLTVDGRIGGGPYVIGIDLRKVNHSRVRNVEIRFVQTGVLIYQDASYNTLEDLTVYASVDCYEVLGGPDASNQDDPNENTIRGGQCSSGTAARVGVGLWVRDANDIKLFGGSFESLNIGIKLDTGAVGTAIYSPRLGDMNQGIVLKLGSDKTGIFQLYNDGVDDDVGDPSISPDPALSPSKYRRYGFPCPCAL